jgi:enoyl-CoA hydratase/carnithine racemase
MLVQTETVGSTVRLTLTRTDKANALSAELVEALIAAVDDALATRPKLLVLQGEGKSFCGGFDLATLEQETDATLAYRLLRIERLLQTLHCAPCHTVAFAHGTVAGAGADLFAVCRKRIAAPGTRFRFPGVRFGIVLGTRRLAELIGRRAYEVVLEQQTVEADDAVRLGLASAIAEREAWPEVIDTLAATLDTLPRQGIEGVLGTSCSQPDCDRDMGVLARSVMQPGLKQRVLEYWESVRRARAR